MNAARLIGLAHVMERTHSGQWSQGYRLMCKIRWCPRGGGETLTPREEWLEERDWAAHYFRLYRQGDIRP